MARLVIFGELGSNQVKWDINYFFKILEELKNNATSEFVFEDSTKSCTLKAFAPAYNMDRYISIHLDKNDVSQADFDCIIQAKYRYDNTYFPDRIFEIGTQSQKSGMSLGFPRKIIHAEWMHKVNNNKSFHSDTLSILWTPKFVSVSKPLSAGDGIVVDLEKAFSNMQFSDIQLQCHREKFECHKFVLAARSPVFHAMFCNDMKENINKEVKLDSMKPKILKEMLSFIYCGKVKDLNETCDAMELLKVADQYQLEGLKDICGSFLSSNLKADNALDLLTLAESCNENHLKKSTMDWLVRNQNIKSLMKTKRWEELEEKFPRLLVDVMKVVVDQKL